MEYSEVIRRRRMVRHFTDRSIGADHVETILRSALRAPSGGFAQGWAFLCLTSQVDRDRFWGAVPNAIDHCPGLLPAPLIIVPFAREESYVERYAQPDKAADHPSFAAPYWYIDAGMASLLMLLTAIDCGLDACFFTISVPEIPGFRGVFGVPDDYDPIGAISIGYRAPDLPPQVGRIAERRLGIEQLVHFGQWNSSLR